MPRLSSCPNCWRQVLLPPSAARGARVRCPLCASEFALSVVQEAELPELILLDGAAADVDHALGGESSSPPPAEGSGSRPSSHVLDDYRGVYDREPAEEGRLGQAMLSESAIGGTELPAVAVDGGLAAETADAGLTATDAGSSVAAELPAGAESSAAAATEAAPAAEGEPEYRSEAFNFYASPAAHDGGAVEIASRPGKRRETNMAVELVKIVAGGAVGLVIAYAVLLYFFRIDPLGFAGDLPRWMVPASLEKQEE